MSTEFELELQKLHEKYGNLSIEERKAMKETLRKRYPITFRKAEMIKHEILRLETKRCQIKMDDEHPEELSMIEKKVLEKKEVFLKILNEVKEKENRR